MSDTQSLPKAPEGAPYEIRAIPGKGFGCFAARFIKRGTRVLADEPLLVITVANYFLSDLDRAFATLTPEQQNLYLSLHSGHGQDPKVWPSAVHSSVQGKERQRIQEQHQARIGKSASLISIFQTNCMGLDDGAAVFPNAARFNHCCNPNACFSWNPAIRKEIIHAMRDIKTGEQITISYCDMNHDKTLRSWELKHYGFVCDCRACSENEDDEDTFAHQSEERRYRLQDLERETQYLRGNYLEKGVETHGFLEKLLQLAALRQQEGERSCRLARDFLDIALVCEHRGDLTSARQSATKAVQVQRDSQGEDFPDFRKYVSVLKRITMKSL